MGADGEWSSLNLTQLESMDVLVGVDGSNVSESKVGQLGQSTDVSVSFKINHNFTN